MNRFEMKLKLHAFIFITLKLYILCSQLNIYVLKKNKNNKVELIYTNLITHNNKLLWLQHSISYKLFFTIQLPNARVTLTCLRFHHSRNKILVCLNIICTQKR